MYLLYDFALVLSSLVLIPYHLIRGMRYGRVRRGLRERIGIYLPERLSVLQGKEVLWIHSVSIGETRASIPLIKALRREFPDHALVLSNMTETGHAIAQGIGELDLRLFFPFDLSWVVRGVIRQIRPSLIIIVETELWPNFIRIAHEQGIPLLMVNGRISDRSFPRYLRIRPLVGRMLEKFTGFCMQSPQDGDRIASMGADRRKVEITGNLKFDFQASASSPARTLALRSELSLSDNIPVWVAGSTHAGEEEAIADAYRSLLDQGQELILILVPRHPERCRSVAKMLSRRGFHPVWRSHLREPREILRSGDIVLGDTLGEMLEFYAVSDLVFLGGSLVPVGGHNVLEASLMKKPVIFGPHMHNFREISRLLLDAGGAEQIQNPEELAEVVQALLKNPQRRRTMGEGGYGLIAQNAGATEKTISAIRGIMECRVPDSPIKR